ncbi:histone H3-K4 methyltransferase Set1 [Westerdykella ornata]|uniref:Histone-lysine N-methyltransferase, H3 lysine-4 specific n=1 Tax=Westerdykella ornata TaxID=318751 RepID=A0A6A6JXB8_WESOR|nr:histone H3-K4 methyltransferase Set1 [Westerdykella ornata]KAF2281047.1 histone H3-K4 methyltransferase Set1 [Westerdykella ornata]
MSYVGQGASLHTLTPLTSTDSSPPGKPPSPRSAKPANDSTHAWVGSDKAPSASAKNITTMTPAHTPPEPPVSSRPTNGRMGYRAIYDPALDTKLNATQKKGGKVVYKEIVEKGDPSPPPDPRLALPGYTTGGFVMPLKQGQRHKFKIRPAPYNFKPYNFDPRISCGPDPATQVVVTGFDPLTPESQIRAFFSSFGEVAVVENKVHPDNGSPLGICLVKYRDTPPSRKIPCVKASDSAKRAQNEGTNQRLGLREIKVQTDREGRKCETLVAKFVEKSRAQQEKLKPKLPQAAQTASPATPTAPNLADLPANVPKGPSGRGTGMRPILHMNGPPMGKKAALAHLIESEPIKPRLKRTPYIFITCESVPVLGPTIEHLQKRLKAWNWTSVRCDRSGYFITFENSRRGEEETVKCYRECNGLPLFTYTMVMECQPYGDPDYERSPSPERVAAMNRRKAEEERIKREEEEDVEFEKKQRAEELDPVKAALEMLKQEFKEKLVGDVKARIAGPALLKLMAPERHAAKRRKLNIPDPQSKDDARLPGLIVPGIDAAVSGPLRPSGFAGKFGRKPLGPYDPNRIRGKKQVRPINVYGDERRKTTAPKRSNVRGLHHALLMRDEKEDSDDENRSSFTRDTEEQESRQISRAPSTDDEEEESSRAHRAKRRRIEAGWGEDSDDEMMDDSHARSLLAHLIHKDPENMAEKELEQVLAILPRSSPIWKKADKALKGFRRLRMIEQEADAIFGVEANEDKLEPEVVVTPVPALEDEEGKSKKKAAKPKKKTKKQLQEEIKAAQVEVVELLREEEGIPEEEEELKEEITPAPVLEGPQEEEEEERASVHWGVSTSHPRRTVEDDPSVVMDIDGWQHMLKDDEDFRLLSKALMAEVVARIGDAHTWAWKQKQIKHLNRPGEEGVSRTETKIQGYYVPNPTGCARTEGVKKIRESEKSKYLPHRIRVQKEREERQRQAKVEERGTAVVEGFKFSTGSKTTSTSNSRANRANNRRLVNDINISKTIGGADGDAIRFNQLKKRKKLVKFDRSAIHNWGLYAQENIAANDMIIEYVGEKVRQRVADLREAKYDMQGVGSSYLFRIDEDTVIDATKMGGIARFINHSCTPNCTAKIIRVDGTKRIVIYALRDIGQDEELTYDYKFEREMDATDRIPCLCGSVGCKGFLN